MVRQASFQKSRMMHCKCEECDITRISYRIGVSHFPVSCKNLSVASFTVNNDCVVLSNYIMDFNILKFHGGDYEIAVFWNVTPCGFPFTYVKYFYAVCFSC
jgi:hypothetical protein